MFPQVIPTTIFRETPSVSFYDATLENSNGCDVVRHGPGAISPPMDETFKQFYVHGFQVDYNLCVYGSREFEVIYEGWEHPWHIVHLDAGTGSLLIPKGCYHRSVSGSDGSVLINQPERSPGFSVETEFIPVSVRNNEYLQTVMKEYEPIIWYPGQESCDRKHLTYV